MIEYTTEEIEEQFEDFVFAAYEDFELATLSMLWSEIEKQEFKFTGHQAERYMLDTYYYTVENPPVGYCWLNEDHNRWVSPTEQDFKLQLHKYYEKHTYFSQIEQDNVWRKQINVPLKVPKYKLILSYEN